MSKHNEILVYIQSERTERTTTVQVETVQGEGDDVVIANFEVEDNEPLDVWGPIFSRIFDELGITLEDPGDFHWTEVELDDEAYLVTIDCPFTDIGRED